MDTTTILAEAARPRPLEIEIAIAANQTTFDTFDDLVSELGAGFWNDGALPSVHVYFIDRCKYCGFVPLSLSFSDFSILERVLHSIRRWFSVWLPIDSPAAVHFVHPQPTAEQGAGTERFVVLDSSGLTTFCPVFVVTKCTHQHVCGQDVSFRYSAVLVPLTLTLESFFEALKVTRAASQHMCTVRVYGQELLPGATVQVSPGVRVDFHIMLRSNLLGPQNHASRTHMNVATSGAPIVGVLERVAAFIGCKVHHGMPEWNATHGRFEDTFQRFVF